MLALDRLLVPVDFSHASTAALRRALDLGRRTGAEVHVLLGSVTERVCRLAPCAVLAVPVDEAA